MGNLKQLAVGCGLVTSNPQTFKCANVYGALLTAIQLIPAQFANVQAIRMVKGEKEAKSAISRGTDIQQYMSGQWKFFFFYDRDNRDTYRCVVYNTALAGHPDPLNAEYTSVAIQYKPTLKSFNSFIRFPSLKMLTEVTSGDWRFMAYVDRSPQCYRLVMTGPEGDAIKVPTITDKEAPGAAMFENLMTNAFSRLG